MTRKYLYHSDDPNFPGSIEMQKGQFPDAVWFASPAEVKQEQYFPGAGGRLLGVMPNGDQIQEHEGVLITIAMKAESWDEKAFKIDMDRVKRARFKKYNRPERPYVDITDRITGDRND